MMAFAKTLHLAVLVLTAGGSGCAAWNKTRPHDMTVDEHQRAAEVDQAASRQAAEAANTGLRGAERERYDARRLAARSGEHAAAAKTLAEEVRAACAGTPTAFPPALSTLRVTHVAPILEARVSSGKGWRPPQLQGARLAIAEPGSVPAKELEAAARCATTQALAGYRSAVADASPFAVRGAVASVDTGSRGLTIEIRAGDVTAATEVLRRAEALPTAQNR